MWQVIFASERRNKFSSGWLNMFCKLRAHSSLIFKKTFDNKLSFGKVKLMNFQTDVFAEPEILKQKKSKIMYN